MKYYFIKNKNMPWGDYGNILLTGIIEEDENDMLLLSRTGPYIPPIVVIPENSVIVTDEFKHKLEASDLLGISFSDVRLIKMVLIDWKNWDAESDEPPHYPDSREPEDYIYENSNDDTLLNQGASFWKLEISKSVEIELREGKEWWDSIPIVQSESWPNANFAISEKMFHTFIDEQAKIWLEQHCDGTLDFEPVESSK